ncbi:2'-5' RNA ligase family protein [Nocardioides sp.]|uniref:2'-5' RNA ligase family protein n=1 Tax=Nocardioides sp. TaxID=35761 RepID=UPI003D0D96F5
MGHSVLLVPVPPLEAFIRARTEHYDTDYLSSDPDFTHAHITALGPFLDELDAESAALIAAIARATAPFDYRLERIDTFGTGIIHLVPDPDQPFRDLTERLARAFPQCPPYEGSFPDTCPHLTLDARTEQVSEESTRALLGSAIPVTARATRLDLAWYDAGNCHVVDSWPLGV